MPPYAAVTDRVEALHAKCELEQLAEINGYPIYGVTIHPLATSVVIWINAGTHGDEIAPVETALTFLESFPADRLTDTRIVITPCLNAYGFVNGSRENAQGIDVNWAFSRNVPEVGIVKQMIEGKRYDAIVDLHEDFESPGYYLYEQLRGRRSLGPSITERVSQVCPVDLRSTIEGEPALAGVIHPDLEVPKRKNGDGVPVEVFKRATDHQITSESPSSRPIVERVAAHLIAIDVFLETYGR